MTWMIIECVRSIFHQFWKKWILKQSHYNFREPFQIPLIKSIMLSSSPIFTFPSVFNHFPEHFKEIMERKDFREKLDMKHNAAYQHERERYNSRREIKS